MCMAERGWNTYCKAEISNMLYQGNFCSKLTKKIVLGNNILFDLQIGHQKVTKFDFQSQFSTSKIQI